MQNTSSTKKHSYENIDSNMKNNTRTKETTNIKQIRGIRNMQISKTQQRPNTEREDRHHIESSLKYIIENRNRRNIVKMQGCAGK